MLAEPIRPGPDGVLRVPAVPGLGIVLDEAAIRRYAHDDRRRTTRASRPTADWIARAAAVAPRTELFIDGAVRAGRLRPDVRRHRRPRRLADRRGRRGRRGGRRPRGRGRPALVRRPALERPAAGRAQEGPAPAGRARPRAPRELALLESLDVGKPIRDTLRVDVPSAATTLQWYAETIDKAYGEVGPTGPDALSLVTREPIGVVAAIVPWNYPMIITRLEARRGAGDRQLGRAQAGQPVAADAPSAWRSSPSRPASRTASSTSSPARARSSATRWPVIRASTRSPSPARPRSASRCSGPSASRTSRPISLELGGKSPQVVLADVGDLDAAASAIGWGIFYNSGQTCNAGSRLVVHRSVREELVERIATLGRKLAPGEPLDRGPGSARSSTTASSPRSSATSTSGARRARRSSPAASGSARRPAATSSRRPSSTASPTRCGSRARRSSARS